MHTDTSGCDVKVVMRSEAGCALPTEFSLTKFMNQYPWVFGLLMILCGPFISLYGRRFFPKVIASIVTVSTMVLLLLIASYVGLMYSGLQIVLTVIVAGGLSIFLA